jgi:hypothetical protein
MKTMLREKKWLSFRIVPMPVMFRTVIVRFHPHVSNVQGGYCSLSSSCP